MGKFCDSSAFLAELLLFFPFTDHEFSSPTFFFGMLNTYSNLCSFVQDTFRDSQTHCTAHRTFVRPTTTESVNLTGGNFFFPLLQATELRILAANPQLVRRLKTSQLNYKEQVGSLGGGSCYQFVTVNKTIRNFVVETLDSETVGRMW